MSRRVEAYGQAFVVPDGHYLLSHSTGCLPMAARDQLDAGLFEPWREAGADVWPRWLETIDRFREALAGLLGGDAAAWCPQPNVSAGVSRLLGAMPRSERRTLLISRHAFPSIGFAASGFAAHGLDVRLLDGDPTDLDAWDAAMTPDVAAAIVMHVHSNNGLVSPVSAIGGIARARGIFLIVDICQSAGVLPLDVATLGADAAVGSCLKWLCGGPGAGFLWIGADWLTRLEPVDRGWFSHEDPFEFAIDRFRYAPDARRFWGGTPSIAPYAIALAGLRAIGEIGVGTVMAHNRHLLDRLANAAPPRWRGALAMDGKGGTLCLSAGADATRLAEALGRHGCAIDRRGTTLRLSLHVYNDAEDIAAIAAALA